MKKTLLKYLALLVLTFLFVCVRPCSAQTSDTCYLNTEKVYWIRDFIPDTVIFEEAVYDSVLCSYVIVAIDTNPWNYKEDFKKFNLIHVADKTGQFMFTIVTFFEDTLDCSTPLQIGTWYDLRLRSVGDNDILWRSNYLDRTFEFSVNGKNVFIGSRMLKFRVVTTESIKDLFYVGEK